MESGTLPSSSTYKERMRMKRTITLDDCMKIATTVYEIPRSFDPAMRVSARVFVDDTALRNIIDELSLLQIVNVATLPGIVKHAYAMPDIHQGYGFPIGGVAATNLNAEGIISPGGIGYDINCGVRLLRIATNTHDIKRHLPALAKAINAAVPSGLGRGGNYKLTTEQMNAILTGGAPALLNNHGMGKPEDILYCESEGHSSVADAQCISNHAKSRAKDQLGTLGSGNHFIEIQRVAEIYDQEAARIFGLEQDMITVMIHCGSRGLGHQTCTDYVQRMVLKLDSWNINLPDRELACAPFHSPEGQEYYHAMHAAANFAWANRHTIGHAVRTSCAAILGRSIPVDTVYDISHNIGKRETHLVDNVPMDLLIHRKGATRAFPAGHPEVPIPYGTVGHPVLIPGTMGTASYVMVGTSHNEAFASCCHGAGRIMSRNEAKQKMSGRALRKDLEHRGIIVLCHSDNELAEEAPFAYKNIHNVIDIVEQSQLARKVARVEPLAVIKGG